MPEKDPTSYSLITYFWVTFLSAVGGFVNFYHRVQRGLASPFSFTELIGELITSGFAGLLTFWLCEWSGVSTLLTPVLVGISGHMGARAIFQMERWAEEKFGQPPAMDRREDPADQANQRPARKQIP